MATAKPPNKEREDLKMTRNLRKQLHEMIDRGETLVNIINYLFTCDYDVNEILTILTGRGFNCQKQLLVDTLFEDFGIELSPLFVK